MTSNSADSIVKSTVDEIRQRFDADVERFSNLETGQSATIDAPLVLELVAQAAAALTPHGKSLLDIGCGAGNYTLKLLERLPLADVMLVDLSGPMLARANERIAAAGAVDIHLAQGDIRDLELDENRFDVVTAAAVLHHLRTDDEWRDVFAKLYRALRPGGSLWIADLIEQSSTPVQALMWSRYGDYLAALGGEAYRHKVFAYVAKEDTPRPLLFQIDLLRGCGFRTIEVLHKNSVFAAFGAVK